MNSVIIFDLDGVLADWSHRLPYRLTDFEKFLEDCGKDELLPAGATIYNLLVTQCMMLLQAIADKKVEADPIFVDVVTCRPEQIQTKTLDWFKSSGLLMPRRLIMRGDDDRRDHGVIKREMYEDYYEGQSVLCVFEDQQNCVDMWRSLGITCFQVLDGISRLPVQTIPDSLVSRSLS